MTYSENLDGILSPLFLYPLQRIKLDLLHLKILQK